MRETLLTVLNQYSDARKQTFSGNSLATFMRQAAPRVVREKAAITPKYKVQGAVGQGNWAQIPWIGIFDLDITSSAQRGYYLVYLFRSDMTGVYLSLNMGWTQFQNKFQSLSDARKNIRITASVCKELLRSSLGDFSYDQIDLATDYILGVGYELGHICGKFYSKTNMPDNASLVDDLRNLMGVYRELKGLLGRKDITNLPAEDSRLKKQQDELEDAEYQLEAEQAPPEILPPTPQAKPGAVTIGGRKKWKTRPGVAKAAMVHANYQCQLDLTHKTFTSRVTNQNYVEAHHLVPMESQEVFEWSLDVEPNIVCLCPNCHSLLHHAAIPERSAFLASLHGERQIPLQKVGIVVTLDRLLASYA